MWWEEILLFNDEFLGNERWWIRWNFFLIFLGINFRGEMWNIRKGGDEKGLVSLWVLSFLEILVFIVVGFCMVDSKLLEV